jgi:DNA-binding Xre family transcriptional regulator
MSIGEGKKSSPTELSRFMGFNSKNLVYHRMKQQDLSFREILQLCKWFEITIDQFLGLEFNQNNTYKAPETKEMYMEDRLKAIHHDLELVKKKLMIT